MVPIGQVYISCQFTVYSTVYSLSVYRFTVLRLGADRPDSFDRPPGSIGTVGNVEQRKGHLHCSTFPTRNTSWSRLVPRAISCCVLYMISRFRGAFVVYVLCSISSISNRNCFKQTFNVFLLAHSPILRIILHWHCHLSECVCEPAGDCFRVLCFNAEWPVIHGEEGSKDRGEYPVLQTTQPKSLVLIYIREGISRRKADVVGIRDYKVV